MDEVTQADRDAAARFYRGAEIGIPGLDKSIRQGLLDLDELVQAFAEHRKAHARPADDVVAALRKIAALACCYGMRADESELRQWLKDIGDHAEAALNGGGHG